MTIVLPVRTRSVRRRRDPTTTAPDAPPTADRVPRVARVLALAHHWRGLIRSGVVKDQAALARLVGVTRARISQVMDLLYLAPDIQEEILDGADGCGADVLHRDVIPLAAEAVWTAQRARWRGPKRA